MAGTAKKTAKGRKSAASDGRVGATVKTAKSAVPVRRGNDLTVGAAMKTAKSGTSVRRGNDLTVDAAVKTAKSEANVAKSKVPSVPPIVEEVLGTGTFSVEKFVECFDVLVEAAGGSEGLRAMVLHLATNGALVSHATHDVPRTLITDGIVPPFGLPPHWEWRRVDEVGELKLGRQRAPEHHHGPNMRPYLRVANVHEARIDVSDVLEMNFTPDEVERFILKPNDVLLNEGQSYELIGRPAIYRGEVPGACFQNTLIRFRPGARVTSEYALVVFRAYMRTGRFRREAKQTTNIAHLSAGRLALIEFPLPPRAEQKRIVARVDQLMALIDELEAKQTRKRELGARFTQASLEALTTAEGPEEFDAAWKRVVENWETVIDRAEKVQGIRTTIFALACRGALTHRGKGETGRELLKKIARKKRTWAEAESCNGDNEAARLLRKLDEPSTAVQPLACPPEWATASLLDACWQVVDCHNKTAPYTGSGVMLVRTTNVRNGRIVLDGVKYVTTETYERWSRRCPPKPGDLIFTREAPIGEVGVIEAGMKLCMGQRMMLIRTFPELVDPRYLLVALRDPAFLGRMGKDAIGATVKHLRVGDVESSRVAIPPHDEQKRIVARVEQLLKQCDVLETALRRSEETRSRLVAAVVQELVA